MRNSTKAVTTVAAGTISRGKYTLLIRLAFPTRLLEASLSAVENKVHGGMPSKDQQGIRRLPITGQPRHPAKDHGERHHR